MTPREDRFTEFDIDMARLMAQWIGGEIARQEAEEALRNGAAQQRRFVRQMLSSVTEGQALPVRRRGRFAANTDSHR